MPRGARTEGSEGREAVFEKDSEPLPLENSRRETATPLAAVNCCLRTSSGPCRPGLMLFGKTTGVIYSHPAVVL